MNYAMKILSKKKLRKKASIFGRAAPKRKGSGGFCLMLMCTETVSLLPLKLFEIVKTILKSVYFQVLASRRRKTRWIRWVVINKPKYLHPSKINATTTLSTTHRSYSSFIIFFIPLQQTLYAMLGTLGSSIWHLIYLPAFQPFKGHVLQTSLLVSL